MASKLFALSDKHESPAFAVTPDEAAKLNKDGYGVFWVVNDFEGRRLKANATRINYWFCDLDGGDKETQERRLQGLPLVPTMVVESRNGYHCYWKAADATLANWDRIVKGGVIPVAEADPKASDPLRLLRAPGYYHQKMEPFLVRVVWDNGAVYTESQMLASFPDRRPERGEPVQREQGSGFWGRVGALDGREAVARLSGHWLCRGEKFVLVEQSNGNANIFRDDGDKGLYSTGCWVRADGSLGGVEGGCSVAAWTYWYCWSWGEVARGLKEVFPELGDE